MKITLNDMRRMGIFEEIETPQVVYHMTSRENLDSILRDGKIKSVRKDGGKADFVTWFFPSLEWIPVYILLTGANHGRQYYDFDGLLHTAPPLVHEETIVIKCTPRGRQSMEWYREKIDESNRNLPDEYTKQLVDYMNRARVCHYGAMPFENNPEIIELTTVDLMPESDFIKEVKRIREAMGAE